MKYGFSFLLFSFFLFVSFFAFTPSSLASSCDILSPSVPCDYAGSTYDSMFGEADDTFIPGDYYYPDVVYSVVFFKAEEWTVTGTSSLNLVNNATNTAYWGYCFKTIENTCAGGTTTILSSLTGIGLTLFVPPVTGHTNYLSGVYFTPLSSYTLEVLSPVLTDHAADVNPSSHFKIKLHYSIPSGTAFDDVRFWWYQCPDTDHCTSATLTDSDLVGSSLLSTIRATLSPSENGNVYVEVPVVASQHTLLYFKLTKESSHTNETLVVADLTGVVDSGLPYADDATSSSPISIPNPVTDPAGFVSAFLTNMGVWLYHLIIPSSSFFTDNFSTIKSSFDTKFAFYGQLKDAFVVPEASSFSAISLGSLHIGSETTAPIPFISSFDATEFAPFRNFLSMIMYVSLAFWLIRKMSVIFSS